MTAPEQPQSTALEFQILDPHQGTDALAELHPSDIAEWLEKVLVDPLLIVEALLRIGNPKAVEAFEQLSIATQKACLEAGNTKTMLRFIENMDSDDRVDLLKYVEEDVQEAMMPLIAQAHRNEIRRLWQYAEGTAGAVMTTEYAYLSEEQSVRSALESLRLQAPNKETIYYVYILDADHHLLGILSLRDLIMSRPQALLRDVMNPHVIAVPHGLGVEEVAATISKYDFLALPVVDEKNRLLGIITVDDVLDILEAENTEDFHRISAVVPFEEAFFQRPLQRLFLDRFWWLAILLFTSIFSTTVMEWNSAILHQMVALSFFIPMVIGTCGNAGTQSATMVVRAMALGEVHPKDFLRVFKRELLMGLSLGAALGCMAYLRVYLQDWDLTLAMIVGSALLVTLLTATLSGALLPLFLKRMGMDPALTAGPFIATIIDAIGITIYFKIAVLGIRYL